MGTEIRKRGIRDSFIAFGYKVVYLLSDKYFWGLKWKKIKSRFHRKEYIRLAVVGTPSSGKSFLLQDIITSLRSMSGNDFPLERDGINYKQFGDYKPDEFGGNGGTPFYACRQNNFYGAEMEHIGRNNLKYDMDFLNIPGEAFGVFKDKEKNEITINRVDAYNKLRNELLRAPKLFCVTTYISNTNEIKIIVEPSKTRPITFGTAEKPIKTTPESRRTRFLNTWEEILGELNDYEMVKGSSRKINGKTLLKHFFEYDTDSAILSIKELIKEQRFNNINFDGDDFTGLGYDRAFVFLHYCSLATDIVLCDRIFTAIDNQNNNEISFGQLSEGITTFLDRKYNRVHVYLAFRNVDFMLYEREDNYHNLYNELLNNLDEELKRNIIYSIFHMSLLYHINGDAGKFDQEFAKLVGLPSSIAKENLSNNCHGSFMQTIADLYVDFDGGNGIVVHSTKDLANHIRSRIGGLASGRAFRGLLLRTGIDANTEEIVPHVYFTCTPITNGYDIFTNFIKDGNVAADFCHHGDPQDLFSERGEHACFGSYQLCMDILTSHKRAQFLMGGLLMKLIHNRI